MSISTTTNLQLKKPDEKEKLYNFPSVFAENMNKVDKAYGDLNLNKSNVNHDHDTQYAPLSHSDNTNIHVTPEEKTSWNNKAEVAHNHDASDIASGILPVARGGTGVGSWTVNRLIYPSSATAFSQLSFPSTDGSFLRQGTSGTPYWTSPDNILTAIGAAASNHTHTSDETGPHTHDASDITSGTLGVARGGTGASSLTNYGVLVGKGTSAVTSIGGSSYGAVYKTSANSNPTIGTLPIAQGGTGATSKSDALTSLGAAPSNHSHSEYGKSIFRYAKTSNQTITATSTGTLISLSNKTKTDDAGIFSTFNNGIQVSKAGYYLISAQICYKVSSDVTLHAGVLAIFDGSTYILKSTNVSPRSTIDNSVSLPGTLVYLPASTTINLHYAGVSGDLIHGTSAESGSKYGTYLQLEYVSS